MKNRKLLFSIAAILVIIGSLAAYQKLGDKPNDPPANIEFKTYTLNLYFSDDQAMYLISEKREIEAHKDATQTELLEQSVVELIAGPKSEELSPTFPPETRLLSVEVLDGTAIVDFSEELKTKHWGGSAGEGMTLGSLVNTLTEFEGIDSVQILLEGEKVDSLLGHMDTSSPLERDESLIK